jgi:DNA helicase-2/ATP-dependent DNA helicase PcrA
LVDEYQDTNTVQNKITKLLASYWGDQANIFVVGDPHQSIYRFQGASLENITQFISWYPNAEIITLTQGYRCPSEINDVAHELIEKDTSLDVLTTMGEGGHRLQEALSQVLTTNKHSEDAITIVRSTDQTTALVEKIKKLVQTGVPPSEIAVLYTKNRFAVDIIPLLDKWSLPYYLEGGLDALSTSIVQQFITLCTVIVALRQGDEISPQLFEICTYPWFGIDRITLFKLGRFAGKEHRSLFEILQLTEAELKAASSDTYDFKSVQEIKQLLSRMEAWATLDFQVVFTSWLETVVAESGLHSYLYSQADQKLEPLLALYSLFTFVKQLNIADQQFHLIDFIRSVETLREQHVVIPLQSLSSTENRIRLSTVHKAKGQEWLYVFLLHLIDGVWGNRRPLASLPFPEHIVETTSMSARESKELQNQDDRRLLYVGMTRAKERVELWYPEQLEQNGVLRPRVPSIFLSELDHRKDIQRTEAKMSADPASLAATLIGPRPQAEESGKLEAYLKQVAADFPLSITALNNYLREPSKFLYQNLLKVPAAKLPHLAFGTAIHGALEEVGAARSKSGDKVSQERIFQRFDQLLQRELLTVDDRTRRQLRGHEVLKAYLSLQDFSSLDVMHAEYTVGYGAKAAFLGDIRLTGRMRRTRLSR